MITDIVIKSKNFINAKIFKKGLLNNFNVNIVDEILNEHTKIIYLISHAFLLVRCKNNKYFKKNIKKRNDIINEFLNNLTDNVILIKYEELVKNFNDIINNLISKFNLESKNNIYKLKHFVKINKKYCDINTKLINLFNKKINIENEKKIKYIEIKNFKPDVCFFHIEKSMGTSLRFTLYEYYKNIYIENDIYFPDFYKDLNLIDKEDLEKICSYNNNFKVLLCHCSFNKVDVTDSFSKNCYSITCVREPINRFISHYYHFIKNETKKNIQEIPIEEFKQLIVNNTKNLLLFRLSGETYNLEEAFNNIKLINCILITEQINSDIIYFNNILNIKYNLNFEIKNTKINIGKEKYDENNDFEYIKNNFLEYFHEDYIIYNTIINMNIENRIKI